MSEARSYRDNGQLFGTDGASSWIEPGLFDPIAIGTAEGLTDSPATIIVTEETETPTGRK